MKRAILLFAIVVLSFTTLHSQEYFTAKQGIAAALDAAKNYFKDSVDLYQIYCVRIVYDTITWNPVVIDSNNSFIDSNGTSNYWYYNICNKNNLCRSFRIVKINHQYILDSIFNDSFFIAKYPININDINIDSDSLLYYIKQCEIGYLLQYTINNIKLFVLSFPNKWSNIVPDSLSWCFDYVYDPWDNRPDGYWAYIDANTGKCYQISTSVNENQNIGKKFDINYDYNTNNIIITYPNINSDGVRLRIYDQLGNLVKTDIIQTGNYELNNYNYPPGLYIVQLLADKEIITKAVMVYR